MCDICEGAFALVTEEGTWIRITDESKTMLVEKETSRYNLPIAFCPYCGQKLNPIYTGKIKKKVKIRWEGYTALPER